MAVAGTATTMQAIALGLDRYDPDLIHRTWLTLADAERVLGDLAAMTDAERAAMAGDGARARGRDRRRRGDPGRNDARRSGSTGPW